MWVPINPDDVPALESLLSAADPFVTSMIDTSFPYRLTDYLQHSQFGSGELCALLDRNLVSRAIGLARGQEVDHSRPDSASYRVAAGCMAFLITGKFLIEPNISLYEFAESVDPSEAHEHVVALRLADHVHPQAYLDIALGRENFLPSWVIADAQRLVEALAPGPIPDFKLPLRHWRRHRCAVAQVALLERSSSSASAKIHRFIDWSATSGFFDATAVCFAAVFFGRNRPRGMLNGVRSHSLDRCLLSIRNAAWDLTYLSEWIRCGKQPRRIWAFCTNDRLLGRLARISVGPDRSARDLFDENWSAREAEQIHSHYLEAWSRVSSDPSRGDVLRERYDNIAALTEAILAELSVHYGTPDAG